MNVSPDSIIRPEWPGVIDTEGLVSKPHHEGKETPMLYAELEPTAIPFDHSELEPGTYEVFIARKPKSVRRV